MSYVRTCAFLGLILTAFSARAELRLTQGVPHALQPSPTRYGAVGEAKVAGESKHVTFAAAQAQESGFSINAGLTGAWYEPATTGQGVLIEVIPEIESVSLGWFTYSTSSSTSVESPQRWFTGLGQYVGNTAQLDVFLNEGGRFDAPPTPPTRVVGNARLVFSSCTEATLEYEIEREALDGPGALGDQQLSGTIDLQRLTPDQRCEELLPASKSAGHAATTIPRGGAMRASQRMPLHVSDFMRGRGLGDSNSNVEVDAMAALMVARSVYLGSTFAVIDLIKDFGLDSLANGDLGQRAVRRDGVIECMDQRPLAAWRSILESRGDISTRINQRSFLRRVLQATCSPHERDVPLVAANQDAGMPGVVPEFGFHRELQLLQQAGPGVHEVLQTATKNAGRISQAWIRSQERVCAADVGSRADLRHVGNFLSVDLGMFRRSTGVLARGRWSAREWLDEQLEVLRHTYSLIGELQ